MKLFILLYVILNAVNSEWQINHNQQKKNTDMDDIDGQVFSIFINYYDV